MHVMIGICIAVTIDLAWRKKNFFWPLIMSIILTPVGGMIYAILMEDKSEK